MTLGSSSLLALDYGKAIAEGQSFKSRVGYLEKGLKKQRIQIASAWAADGTSKYVTLFTDYDAVASAAAQARQEMREFTIEDAKQLPLSGLTFAHVEIHARGTIPIMTMSKRYVQNMAHLVLEVDGKVIQPISKQVTSEADTSVVIPVAFYSYWQSHNVSILTGGTLGFDGAKVEMEFACSLDPSIKTKTEKVILIDALGNKHDAKVDLSRALQ